MNGEKLIGIFKTQLFFKIPLNDQNIYADLKIKISRDF